MNELINRLVEVAEFRGLSSDSPILLSIENEQQHRINIIISTTEPVEVRAPLNLIWIQPSTGTTLRRVSRESTELTEHTWLPVTQQNLFAVQQWDEPRPDDQDFQELSRLVGNPHNLRAVDLGAVTFEGGQFTGPILVRQLENYPDDEAPAAGFVKRLVNQAQSVSLFVNQQLVSLRRSFNQLRTRVTAVEVALDTVEGTRRHVYDRAIDIDGDEDEATVWSIEHNLDAQYLSVDIVSADGTVVICDKIEQVDPNNCRLVFAEPVIGSAVLTKVM